MSDKGIVYAEKQNQTERGMIKDVQMCLVNASSSLFAVFMLLKLQLWRDDVLP